MKIDKTRELLSRFVFWDVSFVALSGKQDGRYLAFCLDFPFEGFEHIQLRSQNNGKGGEKELVHLCMRSRTRV